MIGSIFVNRRKLKMSEFRELCEVSEEQAQNFFADGLVRVTQKQLSDKQLLYVSSILARYTLTSCEDTNSFPCLTSLSQITEIFVVPFLLPNKEINLDDPKLLDTGGSQILLFAGFFRDQNTKRNLSFYDKIGSSMYERLASKQISQKKQSFFAGFSRSFPYWTNNCCRLSRKLREDRYLLKF